MLKVTKGGKLKQKILKEAAALFAEHGYSAVSMRDIATKAGVTVSHVYYYYSNKQQLIFSSLEAEHMRAYENYIKVVPREGSAHDRLAAHIRWGLELPIKFPVYCNLFMRERIAKDPKRTRFVYQQSSKKIVNYTKEILLEIIPAQDIQICNLILIGLVWGINQMEPAFALNTEDKNYKHDPQEYAEHIVKLFEAYACQESAQAKGKSTKRAKAR